LASLVIQYGDGKLDILDATALQIYIA